MKSPSIAQRQSRNGLSLSAFLGVSAWALVATFAVPALAQTDTRPRVQMGIGTFLSHDRGWNFSEPVEVFAVVSTRTAFGNVEAGAAFSKSFVDFAEPAIVPRPPTPYRDGVRARLGLRTPSSDRSTISALLGAELVRNLTDGEPRTTTFAGVAGVGLSFGPEGRGSVDLRYVRFAKQLGSSRAILPLTIGWRP